LKAVFSTSNQTLDRVLGEPRKKTVAAKDIGNPIASFAAREIPAIGSEDGTQGR